MAKEIWITETDRKRLLGVIEELNVSRDKRDLPHIAQLETEVSRARVIEQSTEVPPDVITMRSRVKLRNVSKGGSAEYTLVYPSEANAEERRISVLAPLGTAMIGYRVGDEFEVMLPAGKSVFRVEELLYQPEAAGDYQL